jgi:hypothetical protein
VGTKSEKRFFEIGWGCFLKSERTGKSGMVGMGFKE